jgi:predicted DsbA family dithiol-disulfide isomerase
MASKIVIDVVSDIVWPWCWVGKRKLEAAIDQARQKYEFSVRWHPFMLRPQTKLEGDPKPPETPGNPR